MVTHIRSKVTEHRTRMGGTGQFQKKVDGMVFESRGKRTHPWPGIRLMNDLVNGS